MLLLSFVCVRHANESNWVHGVVYRAPQIWNVAPFEFISRLCKSWINVRLMAGPHSQTNRIFVWVFGINNDLVCYELNDIFFWNFHSNEKSHYDYEDDVCCSKKKKKNGINHIIVKNYDFHSSQIVLPRSSQQKIYENKSQILCSMKFLVIYVNSNLDFFDFFSLFTSSRAANKPSRTVWGWRKWLAFLCDFFFNKKKKTKQILSDSENRNVFHVLWWLCVVFMVTSLSGGWKELFSSWFESQTRKKRYFFAIGSILFIINYYWINITYR